MKRYLCIIFCFTISFASLTGCEPEVVSIKSEPTLIKESSLTSSLTGISDSSSTPSIPTTIISSSLNPQQIKNPEPLFSSKKYISDENGFLVRFSDIRSYQYNKLFISKDGYHSKEDIATCTFNEYTSFEGNEEYKSELLEIGKKPGLGVSRLHVKGITGKGINVGIIDFPLDPSHPEFNGKITKICDVETIENCYNMHAPAVTSLLVGDTIGVAPGAKVFFAGTLFGTGCIDARYATERLDWLVEENQKLPTDQKIRVVSVSAVLSGRKTQFANGDLWEEAVARAMDEGILVIDANYYEDGWILPAYFTDPFKRDTPKNLTPGFPHLATGEFLESLKNDNVDVANKIFVPVAGRTVAEQYQPNEYGYTYWSKGGISWGIPYVAGVLALGWQVNPTLDGDTLKQMMIDSAYIDDTGYKFIDPVAFIEIVEKTI